METGTETTTEPTTEDLLKQILAEQQQHRAEVAKLKEQIDSQRAPAPRGLSAVVKSAEELLRERMEEIEQHSHYCPGCGKLADYPQQCHGTATAPHPPIEVVSVDELKQDDPGKHTAAPHTDNLG